MKWPHRNLAMEIDIRQIPEGERLSRVLEAARDLAPRQTLTLLCEEGPEGLVAELKTILGSEIDVQRIRWGVKDLPWLVHVKKSLRRG